MEMTGKTRPILLFLLALAVALWTGCTHFRPAAAREGHLEGTGGETPYYHYSVGILQDLAGDTDGAVRSLEKAFSLDPRSASVAGELSALYLKKGNISGAIEILEKSLLAHPDDVDNRLLLAGLFLHGKEYDRAIGEYEHVIRLDPQKDNAYLYLSLLYREKGDYEKASGTLKRLLALNPDHLVGNYSLARLFREMKLDRQAEAYFRKTLEIDPDYEPALMDLAGIQESAGKYEEATKVYRRILEEDPGRVDARFRLGRMLFEQDLHDEAIAEFLKVLETNPGNRQTRLALGMAYFFQGKRLDLAESIFLELLGENPSEENARYFLASTYERQGKPDQAMENFTRVTPASGLFVNSRIHMAVLLKDGGRFDEAVSLLEKTLESKPEGALYGALASLYEENGNTAKAEETLLRGLDRTPGNIEMRYRLGVLYEKTGRFDQSLVEMQKILDAEPDHAETLNFIGYGLADRGIRLEDAERMVKKALQLKPGNGYITDSMGWVYFRMNDLNRAAGYLEEAHRLLPDDPTIAEHLGDVYRKMGKNKETLRLYREALERNPDSEGLKKKIEGLLRVQKKPLP
jgi:tetratricopeptide (TPR) repeat protein